MRDKKFIFRRWLVKINISSDGLWWITDSNDTKHYLKLSFCKLVYPDDTTIAYRIVCGRYNIEFGKIT